MPQPIIFTLNRINQTDIPALQFALRRTPPLAQPVFMQQRPRSIGRRLAPEVPVNRPWNVVSSRFGLVDIPTTLPSVVHQLFPYPSPPTRFKIAGVSRDSVGAALAGCTVKAYRGSDDLMIGSTVSDANGNYTISVASNFETYYVRFYLAGSPDRAGTTKNDLSAS